MDVVEIGHRWLIETDKFHSIVSATEYGVKVCVGSIVISKTGIYGPEYLSVGRVKEIENPRAWHSSNIYGVDFHNTGLPTAHLKLRDFQVVAYGRG